MENLWGKESEKDFFEKSLQLYSPNKLFYRTNQGEYVAYWPKGYKGAKSTLQSRNAFIGAYTEKWCADLLYNIAGEFGLFAVQKVVCDEIELTNQSKADLALCRKDCAKQNPADILLIIETKMSVVWNWQLISGDSKKIEVNCIGDFRSHQGNPGLLRSDTMLKAIGKSVNIRVSNKYASQIPIIILGNTPIAESYYDKVDTLKMYGLIQGFWSLNPNPFDDDTYNLKSTPNHGFYRIESTDELLSKIKATLNDTREFFACMRSKNDLGKIIEIANLETSYELKAQKFLEMIRG